MASDLRRYWAEHKAVALKLFRAGLDERHAQGDARPPPDDFPLCFDRGLGQALDELDAVLRTRPSRNPWPLLEERERLAGEVRQTLALYRAQVRRRRAALSHADARIHELLHDALDKVEGGVDAMEARTLRELHEALRSVDCAPRWQRAEAASVQAHQRLVTGSPLAMAQLVAHAIGTRYPFSFDPGFGALLSRFHDDLGRLSRASMASGGAAFKAALACEHEVTVVKQRLRQALGRRFDIPLAEITGPLELALAEITPALERYSR